MPTTPTPPLPDPNPDAADQAFVGEVMRLNARLPTGPEVQTDESAVEQTGNLIVLTEELQRTLNLLGQLQCTYDEMQAYTGISASTLKKRPDMRAVIVRGKEQGKTALRRAQFRNAIVHNSVVMQIWLGKQLLKQSDKSIIATLEDGTVIEGDEQMTRATDASRLRNKIARIRKNLERADQHDNVPRLIEGTAPAGVRLVSDDSGGDDSTSEPNAGTDDSTLAPDSGQTRPELRTLPPPPEPAAVESFAFQQRIRHARGANFITPPQKPIDDEEVRRRIQR